MSLNSLVSDIGSKIINDRTYLIAIDGRSGSGKSSLADLLNEKIPNCTIIHLDDFYLYAEGTINYQRIITQVLKPLQENISAKYQKLDWEKNELDKWESVEPRGAVIFEGIFALNSALQKYYDYKIWIECPAQEGFKRGLARDIGYNEIDNSDKWLNFWMPKEEKYIQHENPQKKADVVVDGTKPFI